MSFARTALCTILLAVFTYGSCLAGPLMLLPETEFDFGYVPQHARVTHIFWLKSVGDADLKIVNVVPGCSCTQLPLEKTLVPAGDSASVVLIFKTQYYRQSLEKHPKIITNENPGGTQLTFRATVIDRPDSTYPVIVQPYKLDLSQLSDRPVTEADFDLVNRSDNPLDITLVSGADPMFSVRLPSTIAAGETAPGHLALSTEALGRSFEASFTFELNDTKKTRFTVPVKRTVPGKEMSPFDTGPN